MAARVHTRAWSEILAHRATVKAGDLRVRILSGGFTIFLPSLRTYNVCMCVHAQVDRKVSRRTRGTSRSLEAARRRSTVRTRRSVGNARKQVNAIAWKVLDDVASQLVDPRDAWIAISKSCIVRRGLCVGITARLPSEISHEISLPEKRELRGWAIGSVRYTTQSVRDLGRSN